MLNEKYGKIKSTDQKPSTSSEPVEYSKHSQKHSYRDQETSYKTNDLHSHEGTDNYVKIKTALLASNLPSSMVNSPAFMQTMTNMLLTMSNQGININTILSQMPSILSNFDMSQNESKNPYPEGQHYSEQIYQDRSKNRANFKNDHRRNFDYNNQHNKNFQDQSNESLLPTPRDYESAEGGDFNFSQAFFNCLSNFSQNIDSSGFNLSQINTMFNESGFAANFNEYYNSGYDNEFYGYNEPGNNNWNNSRTNNYNNFNGNQNQNVSYGNGDWNMNQNEHFHENYNSQGNGWNSYHGYGGKNNNRGSFNNYNNNNNHKYKRKKN